MALGDIIHRLVSVPSTNDAARDLAQAGAAHGTAVVAGEQSRGRGTKGRAWHSPAGLGLYVSFILRPGAAVGPGALAILPLAGGLAAADAASCSSGVEVRLKWPNDLVVGRQKLGGVLAESVFIGSRPAFAVLGIGINVNQEESDFPGELRPAATSLRLVSGRPGDVELVLTHLCQALDNWYNALVRDDRGAILRAAAGRMAFPPGTPLRLTTAGGDRSGVYRGLDEFGRLVLDGERGPESVSFDAVRALDWD